ncbi:MAG: WD40 repeat domain-containing protein [Gemmataceae bacterium]
MRRIAGFTTWMIFYCVFLCSLTGCGANFGEVEEGPKSTTKKAKQELETSDPEKSETPEKASNTKSKEKTTSTTKSVPKELDELELVRQSFVKKGKEKFISGIGFPTEAKVVWVEHDQKSNDVNFASLDLETKKEGQVEIELPKGFFTPSLSIDGQRFGYLSFGTAATPEIVVWDVRTGKLLKKLEAPAQTSDIHLSPNGTTILARKFLVKEKKIEGTTVASIDVETGKVSSWKNVPDFARLSFSRDGTVVALHTHEKKSSMPVWDSTENTLTEVSLKDTWTKPMLTPSGEHLAFLQGTNFPFEVRLFDIETNKTHKAIPVNFSYGHLGFSLDGQLVALAGFEKLVIWNLKSGKKIGEAKTSGSAYHVVFSSKNEAIAVVTPEGITVWKLSAK